MNRVLVLALGLGATLALASCGQGPQTRELTTSEAVDWYESIYVRSNCPTPQDLNEDCEFTDLVSYKDLMLTPGTEVTRVDLPNWDTGEPPAVLTRTIQEPTRVFCFAAMSYSRYHFSDAPGVNERTTYDYPCYTLTYTDYGDGLANVRDASADLLGYLGQDGRIGPNAFGLCNLQYPSLEQIELHSQCMDRNELKQPPTW